MLTGLLLINIKPQESINLFLDKGAGRNRVHDIKDYYMDKWRDRWKIVIRVKKGLT